LQLGVDDGAGVGLGGGVDGGGVDGGGVAGAGGVAGGVLEAVGAGLAALPPQATRTAASTISTMKASMWRVMAEPFTFTVRGLWS